MSQLHLSLEDALLYHKLSGDLGNCSYTPGHDPQYPISECGQPATIAKEHEAWRCPAHGGYPGYIIAALQDIFLKKALTCQVCEDTKWLQEDRVHGGFISFTPSADAPVNIVPRRCTFCMTPEERHGLLAEAAASIAAYKANPQTQCAGRFLHGQMVPGKPYPNTWSTPCPNPPHVGAFTHCLPCIKRGDEERNTAWLRNQKTTTSEGEPK